MPSNGSWQKVRFDEICKNISDRIDDPKQADTDYYVGLQHLDSEDPKISRHGSPQDVSKTKLLFKSGHILFGKRNWYLRRLAVAQREGICSAHMLVLEPIEGKITKEFLPLLMFSDKFFEKALMVSAGSMSPTIKWKDIAPLEFLIPSIEQQENILSITHKIDHAIYNVQNLLEKTKNYEISRRESLLTRGIGHTKFKKVSWLFGKEIEIPEEWEYDRIEHFCNKITSGGTPNRDNSDYYGGQITWIKSGELKNNFLSKSEEKITEKGLSESSAKLFPKNTLLIAMYGATIGKTAILEKDATTNQAICAILPNTNFDSFYLQQLLISMKNILISFGMGAGQPNINQQIIKTFHIPLPPLPEQQKIARILSNINEQITQQQSHLTNLKLLRKSILNSRLTKEKVSVQ